MKKIYIAGKITGLPVQEVIKKFANAQSEIEALNFIAVNPITVVNDWNCDWNTAMKLCIKALIDCEAMVVLADFKTSEGAKLEIELAERLGIVIFYGIHELKRYKI